MGGVTVGGRTGLLGLLGWPVSHSFSPAMHNAAAQAAGLDFVYVPLPVRPKDVATAVPALPRLGFRGVNVTIPHKQTVIPLLDEISDAAAAIGAVNTIVMGPDHHLHGTNTDWSGFLADLAAHDASAADRDCVVLGAGGSARAVVYGLAREGGRVHVLARRPAQAAELAADLRGHLATAVIHPHSLDQLPQLAGRLRAPLIVNTTPLGMTPRTATTPWPDGLPFPPGAFVYDLVYNPAQTRLMQGAAAAGLPTANGLGMLIQQGAHAFRLWTGVMPDVGVMATAVRRAA